MNWHALFAALSVALLSNQLLADEASSLSRYTKNPNVVQLDRLIGQASGDERRGSKVALFAGYSFLYEIAIKPGGAAKFQRFSQDCYDKAFGSGAVRNILACYIAINVVISQIERTANVSIKEEFDKALIGKFAEQKVTDKGVLDQVFAEFDDKWQRESDWIQTLTIKQVTECLENGLGKSCDY